MELPYWGFDPKKSTVYALNHKSDNYFYTPSALAQKSFLYPIVTGHFFYHTDFFLERESYDSFLLIYIESGSLHIEINNKVTVARKNSFVLLDCYAPHAYYTKEDCEILWLHFDGNSARTYYQFIFDRVGMVFSLPDPHSVLKLMRTIYHTFANRDSVNEILMSKYITDILTAIALQKPESSNITVRESIAETTIAYINNHLSESLTIECLASNVSMSVYHFIRIFKKETGFTPHEYITNARINKSRFLLREADIPIKEICYTCGFANLSSFATCFKKHTGVSPSQFRNNSRNLSSK